MTPKLVSADYVDNYRIRLKFADGVAGDVDFEPELWGEVFEPLRELAAFRSFSIDESLNTITWPTGADFAPEFLYDSLSGGRVAPGTRGTPRS